MMVRLNKNTNTPPTTRSPRQSLNPSVHCLTGELGASRRIPKKRTDVGAHSHTAHHPRTNMIPSEEDVVVKGCVPSFL